MSKADWLHFGVSMLVLGQLLVFAGGFALWQANSMKKPYAKRVPKVVSAAPSGTAKLLSDAETPDVHDSPADGWEEALATSRSFLRKPATRPTDLVK